MSRPVYLNRIATAVPPHDVHRKFLDYAPGLLEDGRTRRLFERLASRAQIEHRYSFVEPHPEPGQLDTGGFFVRGAFPGTAARMRFYEARAPGLALQALERLGVEEVRDEVTHLIVTTCTGFYAPGLDLQIIEVLGLSPGVERTMVGFMGCQAAIPAMKLASHIIRSVPAARVLMLNLELCTIHLQETGTLEQILSFVIFADGCAASLLSAEPEGFEITGFRSTVIPESREQISWHIRENGFLMHLAGTVPATIGRGLPDHIRTLLGGRDRGGVDLWAVHPGGRTVLDAVESSLQLDENALHASRGVLRDYGNMSSATVMFVLQRLLAADPGNGSGCAIAFGPGLTAEAMTFERGGRMSHLAKRSREPELMELEAASFEETDRTFREIALINRLTLAYRPTLLWLDKVVASHPGEPLHILDVACGSGDMLRRIWAWAQAKGVQVELTGVDFSADAIRSAEAATPPGIPIRYTISNVFSLPKTAAFDVIISSLFAHHLFDDDLTRFLGWMQKTARYAWLVNDLHRHPLPYYLGRAWVRLMGFGRFVVSDVPISVARGFTRADWLRLLREAGIDPAGVEIVWYMPFRYLVGCLR